MVRQDHDLLGRYARAGFAFAGVDVMAGRSRVALVALTFLALNPATLSWIAPDAAAAYEFADGFENGVAAWSGPGYGPAHDCAVAVVGCSARLVSATMRRDVDVPLTSLAGISFNYYPRVSAGVLDGRVLSYVVLRFSSGAQTILDFENPDRANLVTLDGVPFHDITSPYSWYRILFAFDPSLGRFVVQIRDENDQILAVSPQTLIPFASRLARVTVVSAGANIDELRVSSLSSTLLIPTTLPIAYWRDGVRCAYQTQLCQGYLFTPTLIPHQTLDGLTLRVRIQAIAPDANDVIAVSYQNHTFGLNVYPAIGGTVSTGIVDLEFDLQGVNIVNPPASGGWPSLTPCRETRVAMQATGAGIALRGVYYSYGALFSNASEIYLDAPLESLVFSTSASLVYDPCRTGERRLKDHVSITLPADVARIETLNIGKAKAHVENVPSSIDAEWEIASEAGVTRSIEIDVDLPDTGADAVAGWVEIEDAGRVDIARLPRDIHVRSDYTAGELHMVTIEAALAPPGGSDVRYAHVDPNTSRSFDLRLDHLAAGSVSVDVGTGGARGVATFEPGQGVLGLDFVERHGNQLVIRASAEVATLTRIDFDAGLGEDVVIRRLDLTRRDPAQSRFGFTYGGLGTLNVTGLPAALSGTIDRDAVTGALRGIDLVAGGGADLVTWTGVGTSPQSLDSITATHLTRVRVRLDNLGQMFVDDLRFTPNQGTLDVVARTLGARDSDGQHLYRTHLYASGLTRMQGWSRITDPEIRLAVKLAPGHSVDFERIDYGSNDAPLRGSFENRGTAYRADLRVSSWIHVWDTIATGQCETEEAPGVSSTTVVLCAESFLPV